MTNESDQLPDWAYTDEEKNSLLHIYNVYKDGENTGLVLLSRDKDAKQLAEYGLQLKWRISKVMDDYKYNAIMLVLNKYKYDTVGAKINGHVLIWKDWMDNVV